MAVILEIADAVVTALNAATLSQSFTAARLYVPIFDIEQMATLHVSVVPRGLSRKKLDRTRDEYDYEIDVAVQKKTDMSQAAHDALMLLVEEIADQFRDAPLEGYPGARCVGVQNVPIYAPDHMEELRQFTSVITFTFRVWR
jgi:hypothetical protein